MISLDDSERGWSAPEPLYGPAVALGVVGWLLLALAAVLGVL